MLSSAFGGQLHLPKRWDVPTFAYNMVVTPEGEEHLPNLAKSCISEGLELTWIQEGTRGYFGLHIPSSESTCVPELEILEPEALKAI
jgi:hypothetical protein